MLEEALDYHLSLFLRFQSVVCGFLRVCVSHQFQCKIESWSHQIAIKPQLDTYRLLGKGSDLTLLCPQALGLGPALLGSGPHPVRLCI